MIARRSMLGRLFAMVGAGVATAGDAQTLPDHRPGNDDSFRQPGAGAVTRFIHDRLLESISLADFGYRGDGVTDDLTAWRAALAEAARRGVGRLTVPWGETGVSLVSGSIIDGTPWPVGLVIEAVGKGGLAPSLGGGVELRYTGRGICWNCDTTDLPRARGGSVHVYGRTTWRGLGFRCTDPAGTMFAFNERALRDWAEHRIEPANRCDVAIFLRWESCILLGAGGERKQFGDAIRGALVFQCVVDAGCEIRDWRRGVHLLCSDNNNIYGRLSYSGRNIMIEGTPGGGNDNVVHGPWIGASTLTSETSYPVWDTGKTTALLRVSIEQDVAAHATACIYLNGMSTMVLMPYLVGARVFHLGPDFTDGILMRPIGGRFEPSWAPLIDPPSTYDAGIPGNNRCLTITQPDGPFRTTVGTHPRLRFDEATSASAQRQRHWVTDAFNYQGQTAGSLAGFTIGPVWNQDPDNHSSHWSLVLRPPQDGHYSGWEERLRVGTHIMPGDLLQITVRSRLRGQLGNGGLTIGWLLGKSNQRQQILQSGSSQSTAYRDDRFVVDLKSARLNDIVTIFLSLQPGSDQDALIQIITYAIVYPGIADLQAPPTAADFNQLLGVLRREDVIAS